MNTISMALHCPLLLCAVVSADRPAGSPGGVMDVVATVATFILLGGSVTAMVAAATVVPCSRSC